MDDVAFFLVGGIIIAVLLALILLVLAIPLNYSEWISAQPAIEQLRVDVKNVNIQSSEDVMGQVTEWNQLIQSNRRWNKVPIISWTIPNGWDEIELLPTK